MGRPVDLIEEAWFGLGSDQDLLSLSPFEIFSSIRPALSAFLK